MSGGVISTEEMVRRLEALGGVSSYHGGEVKVKLLGTTIVVGRTPFSRAMQARVRRKIARAGYVWTW